jgi:hypothetical protein
MSPAASKHALRKTLHVATLFTGVTACAAAFAPAANAQTASRTITNEECYSNPYAGNNNTWLHFDTSGELECYGFKGIFSTFAHYGSAPHLTAWCGGNNYGWFSGEYLSPNGIIYVDPGHLTSIGYGPGTTYAKPPTSWLGGPVGAFVTFNIDISGWRGGDECLGIQPG